MVSQNLMPAHRIGAKRRGSRLRRWAVLCCAYTLVLLAGYGLADSVWGRGGRVVTEEFERSKVRISNTSAQIAELQQKLFQAQRLQAANRVLSDQPDWSLLLAIVSGTLQDDIVLKSCQLVPMEQGRSPAGMLAGPTADPTGGFRLELRGYGRSQAAVAKFVLRLETTGLFKVVTTIKINRETFLGAEAVAFQLKCLLMNRSEKKPDADRPEKAEPLAH